MTEILYNFDSYLSDFSAEVISCEETDYLKQKAYDIVLNRTAFFPEQGGQDSDNGILIEENEYEKIKSDCLSSECKRFNILHVSIKNGIIHHICSSPFVAGTLVHGSIDKRTRFDRMQQHSGEHLFSGTVNRLFGYDNVGFHLGDKECTLDFNGTFTDEELDNIENIVNEAVWKNIKVNVSIPSREELSKINYRSKKELLGDIRIVEFPGYDICACCAPHVAYTGEIGIVKIAAYEHFRGGTRIWIKCGNRALEDYRRRLNDCRSISRITSSKIDEIGDGVSKLNEGLKKAKYEVIGLEKRYLQTQIDKAVSLPNPLIIVDSASADNAREAVNKMIISSNGYCSVFIGDDESGYRYIIGSSIRDCRALITEMKHFFTIKGGGTTDMVQGTVSTIKKDIEYFFNNDLPNLNIQ